VALVHRRTLQRQNAAPIRVQLLVQAFLPLAYSLTMISERLVRRIGPSAAQPAKWLPNQLFPRGGHSGSAGLADLGRDFGFPPQPSEDHEYGREER
jgi:hypothetical protein